MFLEAALIVALNRDHGGGNDCGFLKYVFGNFVHAAGNLLGGIRFTSFSVTRCVLIAHDA